VLRTELMMSLAAGVTGGLTGVLWGGLVSSPWLGRYRRGQPAAWRRETLAQFAGHALLYAVAGAALGFLFWLGWGLIAIVNVPWYATGALFGLLSWAASAVPLLGAASLRLKGFAPLAAVHALEWLVACLAAGLLCALSWHRYA
jgi:hypothetical protein